VAWASLICFRLPDDVAGSERRSVFGDEDIRNSVPIIITILQKFPFVTKHAGDLPERRYAVIVDEAHSSQSGDSAAKMKAVLGGERIREIARKRAEEEQLPDYEEEIIRVQRDAAADPNAEPQPFHEYSMRQDRKPESSCTLGLR
jgi:type I site-specific restriction-modification system R (restriction) subunit